MLSGSKSDFIVTFIPLFFFFFIVRTPTRDDDDGSPFRREEKEEEDEEEEDRTGGMHRVKEQEESISVSLLFVCSCVFVILSDHSRVIKVLLIRYALIVEKRDEVYPQKEEEKKICFLDLR